MDYELLKEAIARKLLSALDPRENYAKFRKHMSDNAPLNKRIKDHSRQIASGTLGKREQDFVQKALATAKSTRGQNRLGALREGAKAAGKVAVPLGIAGAGLYGANKMLRSPKKEQQ